MYTEKRCLHPAGPFQRIHHYRVIAGLVIVRIRQRRMAITKGP